MIEKLTKAQEKKLAAFRTKYFRQATSTHPADRERAEKAVKALAAIGGVTVQECTWVNRK